MNDDEFRSGLLALNIGELEAMQRELTSLTSAQSSLSIHLDSLRGIRERFNVPPAGVPSPLHTARRARPHRAPVPLPAPPPPVAAPVAASCGLKAHPARGRARPAGVDERAERDLLLRQEQSSSSCFVAQLEVARQALICGTRVVGLQVLYANAQINFGFMGIAKDHHDPLSHSRDPVGRADFARVQQWLYGQIEEQILRPLRAAPDPFDPGRRILDNTIVCITSEIADGNEHNSRKAILELGRAKVTTLVPMILIGGGGGALAGGQVLDFENRSHKDLLAAPVHRHGRARRSFSRQPDPGDAVVIGRGGPAGCWRWRWPAGGLHRQRGRIPPAGRGRRRRRSRRWPAAGRRPRRRQRPGVGRWRLPAAARSGRRPRWGRVPGVGGRRVE